MSGVMNNYKKIAQCVGKANMYKSSKKKATCNPRRYIKSSFKMVDKKLLKLAEKNTHIIRGCK